jgi:sensor domain CHASE-containing protein
LNLRSKILLIIISFLVLQGGIFLTYYTWVLLPKVQSLENSTAHKNAQRSRNMLTNDMESLDSLANLWANQKILRHLIETKQASQIELLYSLERIKEEKLHVFYILDENKSVITKKSLDPQTGKPFPAVNFLKKIITMKPDFFEHGKTVTSEIISGIFMCDRGPLFVSAKQLATTDNKPSGWLIIGRYINQNMIDTFSKQMRVDLKVYPLGVKTMSEKIKKLIPVIQANPKLAHTEPTDSDLKVFTHLNDISGKPSVVLLSITPRQTSILIKESMRESYGVLLAANFILVILLLKLLHHAIIKPTRDITRYIINTTQNIEAPPRIKTDSDDELGVLTQHLNGMIAEFCAFRNKSISHAFKAGAQQVKQEVIEDLKNSFEEIIPLIENHEKRLWSLSLSSLEKLQAEVLCSVEGDIDWENLKTTLDNSNYYLSHEIQDHRKQVKKIKEKMLRAATNLKSHLLHIDNSKPYTTIEGAEPMFVHPDKDDFN